MTRLTSLDLMSSATRHGLELLLLAMADDEFVIGFSDSEWTGIAPILEEDVAMSSLAQDELGHAKALYGLLADLVVDGRDPDDLAFGRPPEGYFHAKLLDHPRGDWAQTIARRFLYETADDIRLEALAGGAFVPLAELVAKIRREERYHLMHVTTWFERLASADGEPRDRLIAALARLAPDAASVLAPLPNEDALVVDGVLEVPAAELERRWRDRIAPVFATHRLPVVPACADPLRARTGHSDAFHWLYGEFTAVRKLDPRAAW